MPRAKKPTMEIIRVPEQGLTIDAETLDRLIQRRVADALADKDRAILEPWFQPQQISYEIRRHQSIFHKRKFSLYYEKWGCLVCGKKGKPHEQNAMCDTCLTRFVQRLRQLEREYAKAHPQESQQEQMEQITKKVRDAERILNS